MRFLGILLLITMVTGVLLAQTESASLSGRVTDPSGAAVVGASVTVTNLDTNAAIDTQSNGTGNYFLPSLAPGIYRVAVRAQGFRQNVIDRLTLHVQDRITQNVALQVGTATETITVSAE